MMSILVADSSAEQKHALRMFEDRLFASLVIKPKPSKSSGYKVAGRDGENGRVPQALGRAARAALPALPRHGLRGIMEPINEEGTRSAE